MLVKAYIVEYGYKVQSIGIPSLDNNFVTYIAIEGLPTLRIFRTDEYLKIYLNKKGLEYPIVFIQSRSCVTRPSAHHSVYSPTILRPSATQLR